jgi:hypothetical protein
MGVLARKLAEFETTLLNNVNNWAANHSTELYNQTTGPQLQQAAYYQLPVILTQLSDWLVGILQSWQSITGLVAFATALFLLVVFGILRFAWLRKIQADQRKIQADQRQLMSSMTRLELLLADIAEPIQEQYFSKIAPT